MKLVPKTTQYHDKTWNRHTGPPCPFHALPLQSVKRTHMQKFNYQQGEIFIAKKSVVSKKNQKKPY